MVNTDLSHEQAMKRILQVAQLATLAGQSVEVLACLGIEMTVALHTTGELSLELQDDHAAAVTLLGKVNDILCGMGVTVVGLYD